MSDPFEFCPPYCELRACDCCGDSVLVADDPMFPDTPRPATLALPTRTMVEAAMLISIRANKGEALTPEAALIAALFDAFVMHRELLSRAVVFGRDGTGDDDYDNAVLAETLEIGNDLLRIGLIDDRTAASVPRAIDLDLGHFGTELGDGELCDGEDDCACDKCNAGRVTICDVPDCPVHRPLPAVGDA